MTTVTRLALALAAVVAVFAATATAPPSAEAATFKKCGKLGSSPKPLADRIRAHSIGCGDAKTLAAKWIEMRVETRSGTGSVDSFRCTSRRVARGVARVVCRDADGPAVVKFRFLRRNL